MQEKFKQTDAILYIINNDYLAYLPLAPVLLLHYVKSIVPVQHLKKISFAGTLV